MKTLDQLGSPEAVVERVAQNSDFSVYKQEIESLLSKLEWAIGSGKKLAEVYTSMRSNDQEGVKHEKLRAFNHFEARLIAQGWKATRLHNVLLRIEIPQLPVEAAVP